MAGTQTSLSEGITPGSVLQLAPRLDVQFVPGLSPQLVYGACTLEIQPSALGLLEIFACPRSLQEAFALLKERCRGPQQWMEMTGEVLRWYRQGALVSHRQPFAFGQVPEAYDAPAVHTYMLNDRARTDAFLRAIRATVRPGDVVLDIGTGTGVLATAAAQAGAKRVYAVEMSGILDLAVEVFRQNGFEGVITPVRGRSTEIELPERADVLVSEMIGGQLLQEEILEITRDARRRLLAPNPRIIPSVIELWALPVLAPDNAFDQRFFTLPNVEQWRSWYGIDFAPLHEAWRVRPLSFAVNAAAARSWPVVCDAVRLIRIDLGAFESTTVEGEGKAVCQMAGRVNALMTFFRAEVSPGNWLSTHPQEAPLSNHWDNPVHPLIRALDVTPGQTLRLRYSYRKSARMAHEVSLDLEQLDLEQKDIE